MGLFSTTRLVITIAVLSSLSSFSPALAQGTQSPTTQQSETDQPPVTDEQSATTKNRLFGTIPDFLTVDDVGQVPPLTTKMKFAVTARSSFDWGSYLFYGGLAGIGQASNSDPSFGQGAQGYVKRFALATADGTLENFLTTAIVPSLLHQDPRYYRMTNGNLAVRAAYSVSRIFLTRNDSGAIRFNFSELGGSLAAAGLYNSYHPASDRTFSNLIQSWWLQVAYDTGFIVIREFWPDVKERLMRHPAPEPRPPDSSGSAF